MQLWQFIDSVGKMADNKEMQHSVDDQLMNFFGYNNPKIVLFIIELDKMTRALVDFIVQMEDFGFRASQDIETFA